MSSPDFKESVVSTLGKRAAHYCSNPGCGVLTTGPNEIASKSINIGEAAHIYGAKEGSARFNTEMTVTEGSDITNGI